MALLLKIGITLNICAIIFLDNLYAAGIVPTLVPVSIELQIPIPTAANLQAFDVLTQGLGNLVWVPTMLSFDKRTLDHPSYQCAPLTLHGMDRPVNELQVSSGHPHRQ